MPKCQERGERRRTRFTRGARTGDPVPGAPVQGAESGGESRVGPEPRVGAEQRAVRNMAKELQKATSPEGASGALVLTMSASAMPCPRPWSG